MQDDGGSDTGRAVAPEAPAVDRSTAAASSTEPPWLTPQEQDAWLGAAAMAFTLPGVLDGQLQRDAGLGLYEYMVLSRLSMTPERMLRMSELAELSNGSLSRLSNVIKRLEQRRWVQRRSDPTDGRYTVAILTDAGWEQVVAAAPGHVRAVRHFVLDPLNRSQIRQLGDIGQRIRTRTQTDPPPAPDCCEPASDC